MQEIQSTIPKPASQKKQGGEENRRKIKIPYGIYTIFFFSKHASLNYFEVSGNSNQGPNIG